MATRQELVSLVSEASEPGEAGPQALGRVVGCLDDRPRAFLAAGAAFGEG